MATRPGKKPKVETDGSGNGAAKEAVEEDLHRYIAPWSGPTTSG